MSQTIKLLKPLWNRPEGHVFKANKEAAEFAIRKGYAELIPEEIPSKKAEVSDYKNKVEPEVKKLRNKRNAN